VATQKTDSNATTKTGKVVITPRKARTHGIALHL
jgi:hypothetical protein